MQLAPFLPMDVIAAVALAGVVVLCIAGWRRMPDFRARGIFLLALALLLCNPQVLRETRKPLQEKLLIVLDESPSQKIAARDKAAEAVVASLQAGAGAVEPVVVRVGRDADSLRDRDTALFTALRQSGVSTAQLAGTVLVTDGQVHDAPGDLSALGPVNVVLTGKREEFDRRVTVTGAPKYGLVNQQVTLHVRVDDDGRGSGVPATLHVKQDGRDLGDHAVRVGEEAAYDVTPDHAGQNVFEFSVDAVPGELTPVNNSTAAVVNGVRDRLKVLLVSGGPHAGERAWRDLLKSDPAIDLVHFTILRPPSAVDDTPVQEMALIPFPVAELFERRINDFDLIIFDRYVHYGLLQPQYFTNIANFVTKGGAFLLETGADTDDARLFTTALGGLLPVVPAEAVPPAAYVPQLTDLGRRHPVTADLAEDGKAWGPWYTQGGLTAMRGETLMTGMQGKPLLVLDQAEKGRVAVLASDNAWLWGKQGGPYAPLLRNVGHWLMREPELEEGYLKAESGVDTVSISLRGGADGATLTRPDGVAENVALTARGHGWSGATVAAEQPGLYRVTHGDRTAFAIVGAGTGPELGDVHTTDEKLRPVAEKTGGAVLWYGDSSQPTVADLHLKKDAAYAVTGVDSRALVPGWLMAVLVVAGLYAAWRREGGKPLI